MIMSNPSKEWRSQDYKLRTGKFMKMREVLCVPGLKKNILSISALYKKGFRFSFVDSEVPMWLKGKTIDDASVIGVKEGGVYKLKVQTNSSLTTSTINPCQLWHRRLAQVNYKSCQL